MDGEGIDPSTFSMQSRRSTTDLTALVDGSGYLDRIEFREILRNLHLSYSNERFNRLFKALDFYGDGVLLVEHFIAGNKNLPTRPLTS